jgi:hypothetical protein
LSWQVRAAEAVQTFSSFLPRVLKEKLQKLGTVDASAGPPVCASVCDVSLRFKPSSHHPSLTHFLSDVKRAPRSCAPGLVSLARIVHVLVSGRRSETAVRPWLGIVGACHACSSVWPQKRNCRHDLTDVTSACLHHSSLCDLAQGGAPITRWYTSHCTLQLLLNSHSLDPPSHYH